MRTTKINEQRSKTSKESLEKVNIAELLPGGKLPVLQPIKLRPKPKDGVDRFDRSFLHTYRQADKTRKLMFQIM